MYFFKFVVPLCNAQIPEDDVLNMGIDESFSYLVADLVKGFSMGADDFIKKPFSITVLRARVEAHLRREKREKNNAFCISGIRFLMQSKEAIVNSEIIPFTKSEYDICEYLALYHGQIFSKEQIYEAVFGFDKDTFHNVIVEHIKNIRAKLMIYGINPIQTVWGIGYKWVG
jgi:DNA-binding response OmpR family regulator